MPCICQDSHSEPNAARETSAADNWVVRNWQTKDGVPQNTVNALVQTKDGYLWVGTSGGAGSHLLGSELDIESAPGQGTTIVTWVPLNGRHT